MTKGYIDLTTENDRSPVTERLTIAGQADTAPAAAIAESAAEMAELDAPDTAAAEFAAASESAEAARQADTAPAASPSEQTSQARQGRKPRVYSVEFWRFAFTILVALYHLEIFYQKKLMPSGTSVVEFFFILAGFTIALSASGRINGGGSRELTSHEAHMQAVDYLKKKLVSIYPVLAITLIVTIVIIPLSGAVFQIGFPAPKAGFWTRLLEQLKVLISSEWEWLMMVGTPAGFNNVTATTAPIVPLWFLTQLITVGYLYTFLVNRKYDVMMFAAPVISVLGFTFFLLNSEHNLDFYLKMGFLNAGTVRAVTEMAMGISIFQIYTYIKKRDWSIFGKIMFQLLELLAIYRYCSLTFNAPLSIDNFRRIPHILIIVLLSFCNVTFLSKLLNRKFMEKLGKISLPIYLIHFPVATVYIYLIYRIKGSPSGRRLPQFFLNSGGMNRLYQQIPLSWSDVAMYLPFVLIVSVLLVLLVAGLRKLAGQKKKAARLVKEE